MRLVATGIIPKECNVQIPLMELLIKEGARAKGSVLGPIGQHNFEAAIYLLNKGSDYNLATAVGLGRIDDVKKLVKNSTASELYVALVVASFFGKADMNKFGYDDYAEKITQQIQQVSPNNMTAFNHQCQYQNTNSRSND